MIMVALYVLWVIGTLGLGALATHPTSASNDSCVAEITKTVTETKTVTDFAAQPPATTTVVVQSIVTCPSPTASIAKSYSPKSNLTWGCAPGTNCQLPTLSECNLYAVVPEKNFMCPSEYCLPAKTFPNASWQDSGPSYVPLTDGYFYLDPNAFGLSVDIFLPPLEIEINGSIVTTGNYVSQSTISRYPLETSTASEYWQPRRSLRKTEPYRFAKHETRDSLDVNVVPAVCYDSCNAGYMEAQKVGKAYSLLCSPGSAFLNDWAGCQSCIDKNQGQIKSTGRTYVDNAYEQYIDFCVGKNATLPSISTSAPEADQTSTSALTTATQSAPITSGTFIPIASSTSSSVSSTLSSTSTSSSSISTSSFSLSSSSSSSSSSRRSTSTLSSTSSQSSSSLSSAEQLSTTVTTSRSESSASTSSSVLIPIPMSLTSSTASETLSSTLPGTIAPVTTSSAFPNATVTTSASASSTAVQAGADTLKPSHYSFGGLIFSLLASLFLI